MDLWMVMVMSCTLRSMVQTRVLLDLWMVMVMSYILCSMVQNLTFG